MNKKVCDIIESKTGFTILGRHFHGFQVSYMLTACLLLVFGTVVVILLRDPKDGVALPAGKKKARGTSWVGIDFEAAKKTSFFYLTILVVFLTGFSLQGIYGIYKSHMADIGMDTEYVYALFSSFSLMLTGTKILVY